MIIIGFGHKARHGKDTCAQTIIKERSNLYDIRRFSFADLVKAEVNAEIDRLRKRNWESSAASRWLCDEAGVSYDSDPDMSDPSCPYGKQRRLLQWWGTDYRRKLDPFYWIDKLDTVLEKEHPQIALITDLRFQNECGWITDKRLDRAGFTVRVDRLGFDDPSTNPQHSSESSLDRYPYDYVIQVEDGDIASLKRMALYVFDMIIDQFKLPDPAEFSEPAFEKAVAWPSPQLL